MPSLSDVVIEELGLPVRTYNRLKRAGKHTLGQLLVMTDEDVLAIRQIGSGSLADLKERLAAYIHEHPQSAPTASATQDTDLSVAAGRQVAPEASPQPPTLLASEALSLSADSSEALHRAGCHTVNDVAAIVGDPHWSRRYFDQETLTEVRTQLDALYARCPVLAQPTPLQFLDLSVRSHNALMRHRVYSVEKLADLSDEALRNIRNIGAKAFTEIKEKLGIYLAMHPVRTEPERHPGESEPSTPASPPPSLVDPSELAAAREKGVPLNEIGVDRLALSELDRCVLRTLSISTIGELAQQPLDKWEQQTQIRQRLRQYMDWLTQQGEAVRAEEVDGRGISPLFRLDLVSHSLGSFVGKWMSSLNERERQIVEWRYGLYGAGLTLELVGERLGITRERVRQIGKKAIKKLGKSDRQRCVLPLVVFLRQAIVQAGGLATEVYLSESLAEVMDITDISPPGAARLLLATQSAFAEVRKVEAWALSDLPINEIPEINRRAAKVLAVEYAPLSEQELLSRFKATAWFRTRADQLSDEFILACLRASKKIIQCEDGYALKRWERHYQDDMVAALRRLGRPAHYSELAQAVNEALPPDRRITPRAIHIRLMQNAELFSWVGLRGTYGLTEWGVERVPTYEEALAQILKDAGHPLTYQQILAQVPEFRPYYDETSITLSLGTNGRFRSFPGDTYGLAEWHEEDFAEDYRLERLFDEVEAVGSAAKPKIKVVEALEGVDEFITRAREKTNDGH